MIKSAIICESYAEKDSRVRVFHKKNGGVSTARNLGLNNARGEWICFIDSDDSIEPNFLDALIQCEDSQKDIILGGWCVIYEDGSTKYYQFKEKEYVGANFRRVFFETEMVNYGFVWGRLLKKEIIDSNQLKFDSNLSLS
uniref:glycosyltransferase family 2 protein n=1 Tax=Lactobacillus acetotolerans TaxID=1600 RepID=UPI002FDA9ADD